MFLCFWGQLYGLLPGLVVVSSLESERLLLMQSKVTTVNARLCCSLLKEYQIDITIYNRKLMYVKITYEEGTRLFS